MKEVGKQGDKIIVYSTTTCPYCHTAKDYLKSKGVAFEDIDVGANPEKAQEMMNKSGQMGVPVLDIKGKIIVGFNKAEIDSALSII
ncbi:MAG: glutaredoxin domain-containing protein [Candidatus Micrarchaeota archaeon]